MPKRFGKQETWRRKMRKHHEDSIKAAQALTKCMHNPHFARTFWAFMNCRRIGEKRGEFDILGWADACEYCLDRTEAS